MEVVEKRLRDRVSELENKIDKLWRVQKLLLDEIMSLKSRSDTNEREINRIEHVVSWILEELHSNLDASDLTEDKIMDMKKILARDKGENET
ncbi:MAG: hypothetical protein B6U89_00290 [Desulfurococcales archaeon ex4484_58]|nr:MAG: hypothetical protein B6U89_00290 [Desulfurococcales archaeon ex4484_58]